MTPTKLSARIAGIDDSHGIEIRVGDLREVLNQLEYAKKNFKEWQDAVEHYRETLRDRFAMAALTGIHASPKTYTDRDGADVVLFPQYADSAYAQADAMLAARKAAR